MRQIIQNLKTGETLLVDVPAPLVQKGHLLIKTKYSLVSIGTERMLVEFGRASLVEKARQQPDKVKQVLEKIKADGLLPTLEAVSRKLDEPIPLGYCNAGEVIAVGEGITDLKIGDRVVSNGPHAEVVSVPKNLVAKIPEVVTYEKASFTVIGAIALQGIRLLNPTFGETVVVTGLGLIGLMAVQLLKASGCEVIGLDFDSRKVELAKSFGVQAYDVSMDKNPAQLVMLQTGGIGADGVLITASAKGNEVISQAAKMSRKKGRIILTGVVGLDIRRSDFYEKELSFQVSCSYGPGRYDEEYEQRGRDYPLPYVRWTENRNFQAVLQSLATGKLKVHPLVSEVVELKDFQQIYGNIKNKNTIASLLKYPETSVKEQSSIQISSKNFQGQKGIIGIIGSGNFTKAVILPALKKLDAPVKYLASEKGMSGALAAKKFGIAMATTNYLEILSDEEIDAILITTRHHLHARLVAEALDAGKHVFVEKPLALTFTELKEIDAAYQRNKTTLTVGFNRRFSPFSQDAKKQLGEPHTPINVIANMNAGYIAPESWVHDPAIGGGRIIGEACHLIDLISFFTGSVIESVVMNSLGPQSNANTDNASILLKYENGSQGVINYFSNGSKAYSKERIEIYSQNRTMIIDNFRKSSYYGFKRSGFRQRQDKGHFEQFKLFLDNLKKGGAAIIPYQSLMNTSWAAIAAVQSFQEGRWVNL